MNQTEMFGAHEPIGPDGIPDDVAVMFEQLAMQINKSGFRRYSADAILHRIRWHYHIERGDREFKCNDHWTAPLARWFLDRHPALDGFFETRKSPNTNGLAQTFLVP